MGSNRKMSKKNTWSYSAWDKFDKCAYMYNKVYNEGIRGPSNPAADRGEMIHSKAEHYLLGNIKGMPDELAKFTVEFKGLKKAKADPEREVACDRNWSIVEWNDPRAWLRAKLDALPPKGDNEVTAIDFKTGRVYDSHENQAEIYAILTCILMEMGAGSEITIEFWYLDKDLTNLYTYSYEQIMELKKKWTANANRMLSAKRYPAQPGDHCRYCHLRSDKGGPCKSWKKI